MSNLGEHTLLLVKTKSAAGLLMLSSLIIWSVVLNSCSGADGASKEREYFPRAVGMEFEMDVELVDSNGKKSTGTAYRKFTERVERNGKVYFKMRTWTDGSPFRHDVTTLTRKDETGLYSLDERAQDAKEEREVVLPLKAGNTWQWESRIGPMKARVIANESVGIGPRVFEDCFRIRIETPDRSYIEDVWEAPGIGAVKSIARTPSGTITMTLRKFKPPSK